MAPPPKKLDLFVGRLDLSTTSEAVELHVNWILQGSGMTTVSEIPHCATTYGYKGYKVTVTVPAESASSVLLPDKWPSHVSIKRFFKPKGDREQRESNLPTKALNQLTRSATTRSRSASVGTVVTCV